MSNEMTFQRLVDDVVQIHREMTARAGRAVNIALTIRNWLTGAYVVEYEQNGSDRATYGEQTLERLASELKRLGIPSCEERRIRAYRQFYLAYPAIGSCLSPSSRSRIPELSEVCKMWRSLTAESYNPMDSNGIKKWRSLTPKCAENDNDSADQNANADAVAFPPELLLQRLSYTHFELLAAQEPELKRRFYEIECIRGGWSVRELKRQIASLYYERSALSRDKTKLAELAQATAEQTEPRLAIRDPYIFEFLGLKPQEVVQESDFEEALLNRLQEFLLELGHGFCFEARQKRLLIGDTYGFVDLVFYHRILKCHVLIDLKVDEFSHEYLGQLNTYVSWYRTNVMTDGDNPPVGLLLCTEKDHVLAEYALAGLDNRLFVSKYQLELPTTDDLRRFIEQQRREVEG